MALRISELSDAIMADRTTAAQLAALSETFDLRDALAPAVEFVCHTAEALAG